MYKRNSEAKGVLGTRMGSQSATWVFVLTVGLLLTAGAFKNAKAQECPDPAPQTSGHHSFRRIGETLDLPFAFADCQPISLTVRWTNGRNNGGLFYLTFFDRDNHPIYRKKISIFNSGSAEFPLSSFDHHPYGSLAVMTFPTMVMIQAARPFGFPATLHYTITRVSPRTRSAPSNLRGIDANLATALQTAAGRVLKDTPAYTLAEVPFSEPRGWNYAAAGRR